jgi:hypothetical protein
MAICTALHRPTLVPNLQRQPHGPIHSITRAPPTTAHARPTTSPLLCRPCSHLPACAPSLYSLTHTRSARTCPFLPSALTTTCRSMAVQKSPRTISHRHCRHGLVFTGGTRGPGGTHANSSASGADGGERVRMSQGFMEAKGSTAGAGRGQSGVCARARAMGGRLSRGNARELEGFLGGRRRECM